MLPHICNSTMLLMFQPKFTICYSTVITVPCYHPMLSYVTAHLQFYYVTNVATQSYYMLQHFYDCNVLLCNSTIFIHSDHFYSTSTTTQKRSRHSTVTVPEFHAETPQAT